MKRLFFTVLVFIITGTVAGGQSCLPGLTTFSDASQINDFVVNNPGCHTIEGDLLITGSIQQLDGLAGLDSVLGNVTLYKGNFVDLTGLENVYIGGNLVITENTSLTNLTGLSGVTTGGNLEVSSCSMPSLSGISGMSIGGDLLLKYNTLVTTLLPVTGINALQGGVTIQEMHGLTNLYGLQFLGPEVASIYITQNNQLSSISHLSTITRVKGDLWITSNPQLTSLSGLSGVGVVEGYLRILENKKLDNVNAVAALDSVYYNVLISDNDSLRNFSGLSGLQYIGGSLQLIGGPKVTSISGFDALEYVGDIYINSTHVISINAFNNLDTIPGNCGINSNLRLKSMEGFSALKHCKGYLHFFKNDSLRNVLGFQQLTWIGSTLSIAENAVLDSLTGLSNLSRVVGTIFIDQNSSFKTLLFLNNSFTDGLVIVQNNPLLSFCSVYPFCEKALNSPFDLFLSNNAPGCNEDEEVEAGCSGTQVKIKVVADTNGNCQADPDDLPLENIQVAFAATVQHVTRNTRPGGYVTIGCLDTGIFSLTLPQFPTDNWSVCVDTFWMNPDTIADTARAVFVLSPMNNCPQLHTNLNLPPFFRGCLVNTPITVKNQNAGGATAQNTRIAVVLPDVLELVTTTPPVSNIVGDTLFFDTGDLLPFQTESVTIWVHTDCDTFLLGRTLCLEAMGFLDNPCPPGQPESSDVRVYADCVSDTTVRFTLKNILGGTTMNPHEYIIIEDEIVLFTAPFNLGPFGSLNVDVPANGATYRMEATQLEDGTQTAVANEGCGGFSPGLVTAFWLNYHLADYDYDCREVVLAYDPNQKTAIPKGIGEQHLLPANRPVTYTIEFQNTGSDTAFRVLLRDILSPHLDVSTFRPGAASHPYTWEILNQDSLLVLFQPIMLPDSNVNEAASHGFFSFTIDQQPDLPDGTLITNTASIIFDYNPPIITNTTYHTIGELSISVTGEPHQPQAGLWRVMGNPTGYAATLWCILPQYGESRFDLWDTSGRAIRSEVFRGQKFTFERGDLSAGLYFFNITDQQGGVFSGKIVVNQP